MLEKYKEDMAAREVTITLAAYSELLWELATTKQQVGRLYSDLAKAERELAAAKGGEGEQ